MSTIAGEAVVVIRARDEGVERDAAAAGRRAQQALQESVARQRVFFRADEFVIDRDSIARAMEKDLKGAATSAFGRFGVFSGRQAAISQLAFAVEDVASVAPTMGFAGALRAAANNITPLLLMTGNLGVALAAIGTIAAVQVAPALFRMFDGSRERAERLRQTLHSLRESVEQIAISGESRLNLLTQGMALDRTSSAQAALEFANQQADEVRRLNLQISTKTLQIEQVERARLENPAELSDEQREKLFEEQRKLENELSELFAARRNAEELDREAFLKARKLFDVEARHLTERNRLDESFSLEHIRGFDRFEQARDKVAALREELQRLQLAEQQLRESQQATGIDDPQTRLNLQNNLQRQESVQSQLNLAQDMLPRLQRQNSLEQARSLMMGFAGLGDNPRLAEIRARAEADAQRRQIQQMPFTIFSTPLLALNDLQLRRSLAQIEMARAARDDRPTVPQVGLQFGTIAAAQAAAANANATETTRMADHLESIDANIEDMVRELGDFIHQVEAL